MLEVSRKNTKVGDTVLFARECKYDGGVYRVVVTIIPRNESEDWTVKNEDGEVEEWPVGFLYRFDEDDLKVIADAEDMIDEAKDNVKERQAEMEEAEKNLTTAELMLEEANLSAFALIFGKRTKREKKK